MAFVFFGTTVEALREFIKGAARDLGFDLVGITTPGPDSHADYVRSWIAAGRHGGMHYLARDLEARIDLRRRFPWLRSIVCVAMSYYQAAPSATPRGNIARYAWGRDYHRGLQAKLKKLQHALRQRHAQLFESRIYVDTGPPLERELAARAGLGWLGKNTMLIHPRHGSWFVLGELLLSLPLAADTVQLDQCGTCTRCLQACPTAALTAYQMDATRCISYQTLENRGEIPVELQGPMRKAGYLIGCDICQTVCPFNRQPLAAHEPDFACAAPAPRVDLDQVQRWTQEDWDRQTRGRAFRRAQLPMWRRNAQVLRRP